MNDRYDDLMLGLYGGWVPDWIPSRNRELFRRESLRRRCDLGQALLASYRCSLLCGRAMFSDEFV